MTGIPGSRPSVGEGPLDPEELEATGPRTRSEISAATTVGAVHLSVSDLERSLAYHTRVLGLQLLARGDSHASLGAGTRELLILVEEPRARPAFGFTGLYHFALLVPERLDLGRWLAHAAHDRVDLTGAADHFVSEALYLSDPDGHGIEIYWDRPREVWEGQVASRMTTMPLDLEGLLEEVKDGASESFGGLPAGTIMGHVHLKVSATPETITFYRDILGFGLMAQLGRQAAFLSAGGYHHHFGANTWESAGAGPAAAGFARLLEVNVILPDRQEIALAVERLEEAGHVLEKNAGVPTVLDPSGNKLVLRIA
jgi:catechol 2,3-dioxygenase